MVNLNHLRVFYEAAKYQNLTLAAKRLFITQPAVTAQVKAFESQCSLTLFKKKGRKICLTDEGKTLYEYARRIFEYEKELEDVIEDMRELKRGILRLGTTKTYARYFMPFLITSFRQAYPEIKIHLDEGSSLDMVRSLLDLKNEVAVIARVEDHPDVCFIPFSQEEMVLIAAPNHPLTRKKTVRLEELVNEPIIMKEIGSGTRKLVNDRFAGKGLVPDVLVETSNTEFIKQLVQRGDGISFVVREAVAAEVRDKKLVTLPVEGEGMFLDVHIAYLEGRHLSPPAKAFLDILLKVAPKGNTDQGIRVIMSNMMAKEQGLPSQRQGS
jgi:DNA-binding transcriptional LysR family regulator